jgi:hypothetical protein
LIEQTYPGKNDHLTHFYSLIEAFHDKRYIKINGKPLFLIYKPSHLPECNKFIDLWNELAIKEGLNGVYFIAQVKPYERKKYTEGSYYFDGYFLSNPENAYYQYNQVYFNRLTSRIRAIFKPSRIEYKKLLEFSLCGIDGNDKYYPCIFPNWDNTPRCGKNGSVILNSKPEYFKELAIKAKEYLETNNNIEKILFIKSWNEWAEGNHLEPNILCGKLYLEVIKKVFG